MPAEKICRTIHQYCKYPVPEQDMQKLLEVAKDYQKVKNYVYARYGGIGSLPKLYPGCTIQNEMTASGLRQELGLPAVYFYLAIFDALGDIKSQWTRTKAEVEGACHPEWELHTGGEALPALPIEGQQRVHCGGEPGAGGAGREDAAAVCGGGRPGGCRQAAPLPVQAGAQAP